MAQISDAPSGGQLTTAGDGIDRLQLVTTEVPRPGPTELLVKIAAVSLNYRDLLVLNGHAGWRPPAPVVPISDGVGAVGSTMSSRPSVARTSMFRSRR